MTNFIYREIEISAPMSDVWKALTDHKELGNWFCAQADKPFKVGEASRGKIVGCGHDELEWNSEIIAMDPETYFAWKWHPGLPVEGETYRDENRTLVEFHLKPTNNGTVVSVRESGFENIPASRREKTLEGNNAGWDAQMENFKGHFQHA
jgi:uncharacterized protein YndB with AHSA1/START domain